MTFNEIRELVLSFPGVEEYTTFGSPAFRVNKRMIACIAKIDADALMLKMTDPYERDFLLTTQPEIYYNTPHYADFGAILLRMSRIEPDEFRAVFERSWRALASKKHLSAYQPKR